MITNKKRPSSKQIVHPIKNLHKAERALVDLLYDVMEDKTARGAGTMRYVRHVTRLRTKISDIVKHAPKNAGVNLKLTEKQISTLEFAIKRYS